jgi:glycine dehydrogenase subunit 2
MKKQIGIKNLSFDEPPIFELGSEGRTAVPLPEEEPELHIPPALVRDEIESFPQVSQVELVRHFTRLSQWNFSVDTGFYPLGSCTMKYNPKVNEDAARLEGFSFSHPRQPEQLSQGALRLLHDLERWLCTVTGMARATLQPAAGAHGELTGMMMIKAYFEDRGEKRSRVIIPDTAHGTNPASVSMCGFSVLPVKSGRCGLLETEDVARLMTEDVAAVMITNPNTLGVFECNIAEIAEAVHDKGGLVYCDGANLNALMGVVRYGDTGVDLVHMNLHKTFSTPHGGGGPGAGPLAVKEGLVPFLPGPLIEREGDRFRLNHDLPRSIGKVRSFYGNFLICVRAYAYILALGAAGLRQASVDAVINANYLREALKPFYHLPFDTPSLHECVFTDKKQQQHGVSTLDIAKRLIDYGFHPPTIYFPLVVSGSLMIEPTETESRGTLDGFIDAMIEIAGEAEHNPDLLREAPHKSRITRVDEVTAARKPVLRWTRERAAEG